MTERIIVPDAVLAYARQFLVPSEKPLPVSDTLRGAIAAMVTTATDAGLVRRDDRMSWTPPEPIGDHTELRGWVVRHNRLVSAYTPSLPTRALSVSVTDEGKAGVRIPSVWVWVDPEDLFDGLDPFTYGYDEAHGSAVVSWVFTRPARRATIEVRRPAGSTSAWTARLLELYRAGEQIEVAGERLEATAVAHDAVPQHNTHGSRVTLFEDAEITVHTLDGVTPRDGFDGLVALLPPSGIPAAPWPDSRLRRLSAARGMSS